MWEASWVRAAAALTLAAGVGLFFTVGRALPTTGSDVAAFGPFGPEGPRMREQLWILPGADAAVPLRATVFRPAGAAAARSPLVVINHGSDAATREAVSMPVFYWLSKWFVDRGYIVVLPQRRGHGATGGELAEGRDACANPDHEGAGRTAADDIEHTVRFMAAQPFVDPGEIVVVGISTGGWASLALAARATPGVRLVVNFAGGRGGHAYGRPNAICGPERLIEAAGTYARTASVPTVWFYAANDSYFGPELATAMARSWRGNGGRVELNLLPAYQGEGHEIVSDRAGWNLWGATLEDALAGRARAGAPVGISALGGG